MDGELTSSRYDGGGGGGRSPHHHHHHHGRRSHYSRGRGNHHGGGRSHHRHHPYGGRRRPPPPPRGNRFSSNTTKSVDQKTAVMEQLSAMVSRVGDVEATADMNRIEMISKNITDLAKVLCSPSNSVLFLGFETQPEENNPEAPIATSSTIDAKKEAGHLAHLVVSCVMALPLQTSTHVGLTLAVHEYAPADYQGFANRCVTYATRILSREFDKVFFWNNNEGSVLRIQHLLRYLALLGKIHVVVGHNNDSDNDGSVLSLLQSLVTAARQAVDKNKTVAFVLAHIVFSTIPHLLDYIPSSLLQELLVEPLETHVLQLYKSTYWPGLGKDAILLKQEQKEGTSEEEEESEDEDDDDEEEAGQRCDTLHDLVRTVKTLMEEQSQKTTTDDAAAVSKTQFSLLSDAPWTALFAEATPPQVDDPETKPEDSEQQPQEKQPLVYTGEPLRLALSPDCRSIPALLNASELDLNGSLEGIVHGRLPMFGGPASDDNDDDDDDDEEEDGMEETPANAQLQAYQKNFGLVDRFFLSDVVRDCLTSHKSTVSDSGLARGTAKDTAKQLLAIRQVFAQGDGIEYGIIETVLSLVVQSKDKLKHFYYSRILLELTRLQPLVMAPALVVGVANLVQDYLPSLVPQARENLSTWFAFHLENTDYQWPAGYWEHWTPFVAQEERSSRGDFCRGALQAMASHVSSISTICTNCLPQTCTVEQALLCMSLVNKKDGTDKDQPPTEQDAGSSIQKDLEVRLWETSEDAETVRAYMVGDEVSETMASSQGQEDPWWRSRMVLKALLRPAKQQKERMTLSIRQAKEEHRQGEDQDMVVTDASQAEEIKHDVLTEITDMLVRYKPLLLATLARDCEESQGDTESVLLQTGEANLLMQLEESTGYSRVILMECVTCLLRNEIVSPMGVLHWAFREQQQEGHQHGAILQWWKFAQVSLSVCLELQKTKDESSGDDIGMVVDGDELEDPKQTELTNMLDVISPLLKYVLERVCKILLSMDNQDGKLKHSPAEVDLIEGVKQLVLAAYDALLLEFTNRAATEQDAAKKNHVTIFKAELVQSEIEGGKLAALCRSHDNGVSPATELLAQILEGIAG